MKINIGVIGSGFIAKNFYNFCKNNKNYKISKLLTRSNIKNRTDIDNSLLINDLNYIIKNSDIVFDCSGDAIYSTEIIAELIKYNLPIVTMNSELHVTIGDYFNNKGIITEAEGDQPGCLAKLNNELIEMQFNPFIYGIHKGFLNYNPNIKHINYWSNKNGISKNKTMIFTDGSKVEIECIFTANALDCYISNLSKKNINESTEYKIKKLYKEHLKNNKKYVDFFIGKRSPPGVFIVANHNTDHVKNLNYLKIGKEYFTLEKPYHLCYMEVLKTIDNIIKSKKILMNTKVNRYMPAAIAKCDIKEGFKINRALGSYEFRCVSEINNKKLIPITLLTNCVVNKNINEGQIITINDISLTNSKALNIWKNLK